MYLALTSVKGAPGVTTTAVGLALTGGERHHLVVEADITGSSSILAGYFKAQRRHDRGLLRLVRPNLENDLDNALPDNLISESPSFTVLPGIAEPRHAAQVAMLWDDLGRQLGLYATEGARVLVDCGQFGAEHGPLPLLSHADVVGVVIGSTLPQIAAARVRIPMIRHHLSNIRSRARLGLIVVGDYPYTAAQIADQLKVPAIATIVNNPKHARVFSEGAVMPKWKQRSSPYLRSLRQTWNRLETFHASNNADWLTNNIDLPEGATRG
ncbi:hypothetical protein GS504_01225 [Rhodococcus hoagii]|nr:hypothetical protein [Prescottella equi]NKS71705.1 hypothetical protein [Prescottella equi]